MPFLEQAAETAKRDFQLIDAANLSEQVANILEIQNKPDEAFEQLKRARENLSNSSQYDKIETFIERMLKLAHTNEQHAISYHARSEYLSGQRGDFAAAEQAAREGLKYAEAPEWRASLLGDVGTSLWYQDRLTEAIEPFREAVKIHQSISSKELVVSLSSLSLALQYLGHYREALELQEQTITLLRQDDPEGQLPVVLTNYAITLGELGYTKQSITPLREALELLRKMQGMELTVATTLLTLGQSQCFLCQFKRGLELLHEALSIAETYHHIGGGFFAVNLVGVYSLLGQSNLAKSLLDKAMLQIPEFPSVRGKMFREQARWLIEQGQYEEARTVLDESRQALAGGQRQTALCQQQLLKALILPPRKAFNLLSKY